MNIPDGIIDPRPSFAPGDVAPPGTGAHHPLAEDLDAGQPGHQASPRSTTTAAHVCSASRHGASHVGSPGDPGRGFLVPLDLAPRHARHQASAPSSSLDTRHQNLGPTQVEVTCLGLAHDDVTIMGSSLDDDANVDHRVVEQIANELRASLARAFEATFFGPPELKLDSYKSKNPGGLLALGYFS